MGDKRVIHLVDDHEAIRKAAGFMLRMSGFRVEIYSSGTEFLGRVRSTETGCVIMDMHMPGMNGLQVQAAMAQRSIVMPLVVLTADGDISLVVQAMRAGAVDFLTKPVERCALLDAVDRAFTRIDHPDLRVAEEAEASAKLARLTKCEREILNGLVQGHPNKTIASNLGISPRSMDIHRASLMVKLGVNTLPDTLRIAFAAGMGKASKP